MSSSAHTDGSLFVEASMNGGGGPLSAVTIGQGGVQFAVEVENGSTYTRRVLVDVKLPQGTSPLGFVERGLLLSSLRDEIQMLAGGTSDRQSHAVQVGGPVGDARILCSLSYEDAWSHTTLTCSANMPLTLKVKVVP